VNSATHHLRGDAIRLVFERIAGRTDAQALRTLGSTSMAPDA
jgi:hypothetical protein